MFSLQIGDKNASLDWPEIIKALSSFAWPIVAVVVLLIFRREISGFIGRLKAINWLGLDAKLDDVEEKVSADAVDDPPVPNPTIDNALPLPQDQSPLEVIIRSWAQLEGVIRMAIIKFEGRQPNTRLVTSNLNLLKRKGIADPGMLSAVDELRHIRNRVVHHPEAVDLTSEVGERFAASANLIARTLAARAQLVASQDAGSALQPDPQVIPR